MTRQKHRTAEDQQRWQEQQAARTTALMEQLEAGIQAIQTSDDFKKYLAAAAHRSRSNFGTLRRSPRNAAGTTTETLDASQMPGYPQPGTPRRPTNDWRDLTMTRQKHRTAEDQQRWQAEQAARTTALMEQLEAGIQAIQTSGDFRQEADR